MNCGYGVVSGRLVKYERYQALKVGTPDHSEKMRVPNKQRQTNMIETQNPGGEMERKQ